MDSEYSKNIIYLTEEEYYDSLNEVEKKVFNIAKDHLGTNFHIKKSNGYENGGGIREVEVKNTSNKKKK